LLGLARRRSRGTAQQEQTAMVMMDAAMSKAFNASVSAFSGVGAGVVDSSVLFFLFLLMVFVVVAVAIARPLPFPTSREFETLLGPKVSICCSFWHRAVFGHYRMEGTYASPLDRAVCWSQVYSPNIFFGVCFS
jgi:hypothetical protein